MMYLKPENNKREGVYKKHSSNDVGLNDFICRA